MQPQDPYNPQSQNQPPGQQYTPHPNYDQPPLTPVSFDDEKPAPYPFGNSQLPDFVLDADHPLVAQKRKSPLKAILIVVGCLLMLGASVALLVVANQLESRKTAQTEEQSVDPNAAVYDTGMLDDNIKLPKASLKVSSVSDGWIQTNSDNSDTTTFTQADNDSIFGIQSTDRGADMKDMSNNDATENYLKTIIDNRTINRTVFGEPIVSQTILKTEDGKEVEFMVWDTRYQTEGTESWRTLRDAVRVTNDRVLHLSYDASDTQFSVENWENMIKNITIRVE